jgi:hypothetical protein
MHNDRKVSILFHRVLLELRQSMLVTRRCCTRLFTWKADQALRLLEAAQRQRLTLGTQEIVNFP